MVQLNSKGEVADFQDADQFSGGRTAYACVAFSACLLKYMGQPGHGPTGSALDIAQLAYYWYGKLEGSSDASNTNGMSLDAEYTMLKGLGLSYEPITASVESIKAALSQGHPVLFCGAETGMYDVALGDRIPYTWTPSGNHAIVVSGIAPDGNLLVHDCASIAPGGVRPGPRTYDASKLQPVSATAIIPAWLSEDTMAITVTDPSFIAMFDRIDDHHYRDKTTGKVLQYGNLSFYLAENGPARLGSVQSNEIVIDANGSTKQYCLLGTLIYTHAHGTQYASLYDAATQDPRVAQLTQELQQAQTSTTQNDAAVTALKQVAAIVDPFNK